MSEQQTKKEFAQVNFGTFGVFVPLLTLGGLILIMSITGMRSTTYFFSAGFIAMMTGFVTYKDKDVYMSALVAGFANRMLCTMMLIFFITAVFSRVVALSGVATSLVILMESWNIPLGILPVVCFLMSCVISTATGSSSAASSTLIPIMLPLGVQMGIHPGLMMGVIASGGMFGDNLSPISDSAIASSQGAGADLSLAARARVKYSAIAFVPTVALFLVQGLRMAPSSGTASGATEGSLANLVFLLLPVLIFTLILMKANFVVALFSGIVAGVVMLFAFGLADVQAIVGPTGIIFSGVSSIVNTILFMMMIFVVMSLTEKAGGLELMTKFITRFAKTERSAEAACGVFMCVTCAITGSGISSMGFCGPLIARILEPFKVTRERVANIINGFGVSVVQGMIPWSPPMLGTVAMCCSTGAVDAATFTPFSYLPYTYYAMMLFLVYWISILTGFGRTHTDDAK